MFRSKEDQFWQILYSTARVCDSLSGIKELEEDRPSKEEAYMLAKIEQHIMDLRNETKKSLIAELKA